MNYYKIDIAYDGTKYDGWQRQNNTSSTIQHKIENALSSTIGEEIAIDGAGRTDAGVHARNQVASFSLARDIDCDELQGKISAILPKDIAVTKIVKMNDRFHARLNATGKIYQYRIFNRPESPVFERNYVFHHPDFIDIDRFKAVADKFIGTHDFALFQDNKHMKKSTVRTIHNIDIDVNNGLINVTFKGDGFMYHMIRHLVGIMMFYATSAEDIPSDFFEIKERNKKWPLAPAKGLTLLSVLYD